LAVSNGIEIEHKYLIEYPDRDMLLGMPGASSAVISQTYIKSAAGSTERARKWEQDGQVTYYHTVKRRISDMSHFEDETEITAEEYERLLERKKKKSSEIVKERIMIPYGGRVVEVDLFRFWDDRAVAEVEVLSEDEEPALPDCIKVIREVTDDGRYKNASLAYDHSFPV